MSFNKKEYDNNFRKENYDSILLRLPKSKKQLLKDKADELNISVNEMIIQSIEKTYSIDLRK